MVAQEVFAAMRLHMQRGGILAVAEELFNRMPERDLVSFNTMISGYARAGHMDRAQELLESVPLWDPSTWTAIISGDGWSGETIHAKQCFDSIPARNGAYSRGGHAGQALDLFRRMDLDRVPADRRSVAVAICTAMSDLPMGRIIHGEAMEVGMAWDVIVASSLVDLSGKCGESKTAMAILEDAEEEQCVVKCRDDRRREERRRCGGGDLAALCL